MDAVVLVLIVIAALAVVLGAAAIARTRSRRGSVLASRSVERDRGDES